MVTVSTYKPSRYVPSVTCALLLAALSLLPGLQAAAASYEVQASVPYPAPDQAAVFDQNLDGTTVRAAALTLAGTCQIMNPVTAVSIWRGSDTIGSATCTSGRFSLQVQLVPGANTLVARTANASSLYGPDSQPLTITLDLPAELPPVKQSTATAEPTTPQELVAATNAAATSGLVITTTQPFSVVTDDATVNLQVVVSGGSGPYTINLNWGDGSQESHSVPEAGTYTYAHTYRKSTNYSVRAGVRDAMGAYSVFTYAVVSYRAQTGGNTPPTDVPGTKRTVSMPTWLPAVFASVVLGGLLFGTLGYHAGLKRLQPSGKQKPAKKRPVPRKRR